MGLIEILACGLESGLVHEAAGIRLASLVVIVGGFDHVILAAYSTMPDDGKVVSYSNSLTKAQMYARVRPATSELLDSAAGNQSL